MLRPATNPPCYGDRLCGRVASAIGYDDDGIAFSICPEHLAENPELAFPPPGKPEPEPEYNPEDDDCSRCGGSGGGAYPMFCGACGGSGISRRAKEW